MQNQNDVEKVEKVPNRLDPGALPLCGPQDGDTPLQLAALHGHKEVAALLLDRRANLEAIDKVSSLAGMWMQLHGPLSLLACGMYSCPSPCLGTACTCESTRESCTFVNAWGSVMLVVMHHQHHPGMQHMLCCQEAYGEAM